MLLNVCVYTQVIFTPGKEVRGMEKCICRICCAEMWARKDQFTITWVCPECGYNISTSYVSHSGCYDVGIFTDTKISNNAVRELSVFLGLNFLQTKMRCNEGGVITLKCTENNKNELVEILSKYNISYTVTKV